MLRTRVLVMFLVGFLFVLALWVLPVVGDSSALCSIRPASAQENPCLAQEGTITALKGALLQATIDSMNHQATVTALQANPPANASSGAAASTATPKGDSEYLLVETFDNNDRGWELRADNSGSKRLSAGKLMLSTPGDAWIGARIPDFRANQFYLEVTVSPQHRDNRSYCVGFSIVSEKASFLGACVQYGEWSIRLFAEGKGEISSTPIANALWKDGQTALLGLELRNGVYTLYVNGSATDSFQLAGDKGVSLALYTLRSSGSTSFDDLKIRKSR